MKLVIPLAVILAAAAAPAFAQDAGAPGATGAQGPLTGSNVGSGYGPSYDNAPYPNGAYDGPGPGWESPGVIEAPGPYYGPRPYYGPGPVYGGGTFYGPGMIEGRAAAPQGDYSDPNPHLVRGDQNGQDQNW